MTESNSTELAAVAAAENGPMSIRDTVLAQFKDAEVIITGLAEKYRDVAYPVDTPKGMREAFAARADLRDNGRLFVTKSEARIKSEVNDLKRVMASETERLVGIIKPVEDAVDEQIKAEEKRKADEKAERERIEGERVAGHIAKINTIRAAADKCKGITSERILNGIALVEGMAFGEDCEDYLPKYEQAKAETLAAMRAHLSDAQAREAAEAQRLENERIAAELAEQRAALERQAADLKRQQDEAKAARIAITHAAVFAFPEPEPGPEPEVITPGTVEVASTQSPAEELAAAQASDEGTELSPAAQALNEEQGATRFAKAHPAVSKALAEPAPVIALINTADLCVLVGLDLSTEEIRSFGLASHATPAGKRGTFWAASDADVLTDAIVAHLLKRKTERNA